MERSGSGGRLFKKKKKERRDVSCKKSEAHRDEQGQTDDH
jgi:hypothetical protein